MTTSTIHEPPTQPRFVRAILKTGELMTTTTTRERVSRYIVIRQESGRIVATCGGTHRMMERICNRLDERRGGTYIYDDASSARDYLPQIGPNIALSVLR